MLQLNLERCHSLSSLLQVSLRKFGALFSHFLVKHGHFELVLCIEDPAVRELRELLRVSKLATRRDEVRL